ncbi:thioesterase II family protein [Sphaerisporangium aureirubrum]|uniref:Thioesterase II family protein n=1 Tax=Sphaerisporangium aureirubrum TaxID=1544736 RepID=A0ABW1NK61_9ACTN
MCTVADEVGMNAHPQDIDRRWLKRFGRTDDTARIRLLCFHHAGGNAGMYRHWRRLLPAAVELVAVQLPGRADRFTEPAHDRMTCLVRDLADVLKPLLDRSFACYGISMGARVAWALTHTLREMAMPLPTRLYVACDPGPATDDGTWPWEGPGGVEGHLREMGGTPPEVLDQPELLRAVLPTFRADLAVLSTHDFRPLTPLAVPIRAFAGVDDPVGTPERVASWRTETTAGFQLHHVAGGHFLTPAAERQVVQTIVQDLI